MSKFEYLCRRVADKCVTPDRFDDEPFDWPTITALVERGREAYERSVREGRRI